MNRPSLRPGLRALAALCLTARVLVTPSPAHAQTAAEQYQRGLTAMHDGRHAEAALAFEASYEADPQPVVLFNLGIAYASLARPHTAVSTFETYLRAADPEVDAANIAAVRAEIARLRRESAVVVPKLSPVNAVLTVDGRAVQPAHGEVLLAPGTHEIAVRADGHHTQARRIDAAAGRFLLEISLDADTGAATVPVVRSAPPTVAPSPAPAPSPVVPPTPLPPWPAPQPRETPTEPAPEPPPEEQCAGGDWCLGPMLTLGLPVVVGAGFHVRQGEHLGFTVDFQLLPTITIGDGSIGLTRLSSTVRVHPFGGSFFLALGLALYSATGDSTVFDPTTGELVEGEGSVTFPGLVLGIGMEGHDGFVLGIDFAAVIPIGATTVGFEVLQGDPDSVLAIEAERIVRSTIDSTLDALPFVPQLNLLRVGYFF